MREELTQAELDEIFYGKAPRVVAEFYKHLALNPAKSRKQGNRVMEEKVYIHLNCEKEGSEIRRPASKQDQKMYAREYAAFLAREDADHERTREVSDLHASVPDLTGIFKAQSG
jgi:hypothetical protein